jgi:phenol 2-monooxygenase (NADPH)
MGVAYDGMPSALLAESEQGIWKAGRRCPDIYLNVPRSIESRRLYSSVSYGRFLVISIGGLQDTSLRRFQDVTTPFHLFPSNEVPADADEKTFGSDIAIPGEKFVVVVRPDMYIGCVGSEAAASAYLSSIFRG